MLDQRLKELRGTSRRDFLRWSATVAACLGLERSRLLIRDIIRGGVHRPSIYFARVTSTSRTASDP